MNLGNCIEEGGRGSPSNALDLGHYGHALERRCVAPIHVLGSSRPEQSLVSLQKPARDQRPHLAEAV